MSNYTKKQTTFAVYILKQFGIEDTTFIEKFLQYYAMAYGYYRQYDSGTFFNTSDSVGALMLEKEIRKDRNKILKKTSDKNHFNATDFSNFIFCPASFAINYSFVIEHPTGKKQTDIGIALHNKLNLIQKAENYQKTKQAESDIFRHPDILKILSSKVVYYAHNKEDKKSFFNEVNKVASDPDYIFIDENNEHFIVEEKYHYYKDPRKATYEEKWMEWNGYIDTGVERDERIENWDNSKLVFFRNHQIQVITYLKNIDNYTLKYGYLVYWYYDFDSDNEPYIHKVGVKRMVLDNYTEEFYNQTIHSIKIFVSENKQKFEVESINPNKCAGCVVNKYCGHKSKKYNELTFPYSLDYLRFFPVEFPEELKKTNL